MEIVTFKKDDGTALNVHCFAQEEIEKLQAIGRLQTFCRYQRRAIHARNIFVSCVAMILVAIVLLFIFL